MEAVICAIAKMENDYINDWCKYHFNLGFSEIYIYDNNDPDYEPIETRIDKSYLEKVHILKIPYLTDFQRQKYTEFYKDYKSKFDWCAFIDIDEFITLTKWSNIKAFLNDPLFKKENVIRLNWEIFDDNNQVFADVSVPVYERFTHTTNRKWRKYQAKSIVRGGLNKVKFKSCHYPTINGVSENYINADGTKCNKAEISIHTEIKDAYIRHYMTKTISEFVRYKFNRGDAEHSNKYTLLKTGDTKSLLEYFFKINKITTEKIDYLLSKNIDVSSLRDGKIAYWASRMNAGDYFSLYLAEKLGIFPHQKTAIVGSILGIESIMQDCGHIWGSGFHGKNNEPVIKDISKYHCVRGVESRKILSKYGDTNNIALGDPGLLASYVYNPMFSKKYDIGIISHWEDETLIKQKMLDISETYNLKFISMKTNKIEELLDEILSCKIIISSSLHGIIFAHSYCIPCFRLRMNDSTYLKDFKFIDYYSTLDINQSVLTDLDDKIIEYVLNYNETQLYPSLGKLKQLQSSLITSCPFQSVRK